MSFCLMAQAIRISLLRSLGSHITGSQEVKERIMKLFIFRGFIFFLYTLELLQLEKVRKSVLQSWTRQWFW